MQRDSKGRAVAPKTGGGEEAGMNWTRVGKGGEGKDIGNWKRDGKRKTIEYCRRRPIHGKDERSRGGKRLRVGRDGERKEAGNLRGEGN